MGNVKIIKIVRDLTWINMVHFTLTQMVIRLLFVQSAFYSSQECQINRYGL